MVGYAFNASPCEWRLAIFLSFRPVKVIVRLCLKGLVLDGSEVAGDCSDVRGWWGPRLRVCRAR